MITKTIKTFNSEDYRIPRQEGLEEFCIIKATNNVRSIDIIDEIAEYVGLKILMYPTLDNYDIIEVNSSMRTLSKKYEDLVAFVYSATGDMECGMLVIDQDEVLDREYLYLIKSECDTYNTRFLIKKILGKTFNRYLYEPKEINGETIRYDCYLHYHIGDLFPYSIMVNEVTKYGIRDFRFEDYREYLGLSISLIRQLADKKDYYWYYNDWDI